VTADEITRLARECGFELAGVARAEPLAEDSGRYLDWVGKGMAGAMGYLTDRRATVRTDPKLLLPSARSIICVGKLYNSAKTGSTAISRYAWGDDYHDVVRRGLEKLIAKLPAGHDYKICVDTAPLLERSYARQAGLGWIGKNTCLINQEQGSWFFLGEILTSLEIDASSPPPDRCGTCTRCIDACPTQALAPEGYEMDARRCISYFTIELHGSVPEDMRASIGQNIFGCDICQDVCPWNRDAPVTVDPAFEPRQHAALRDLAQLTSADFTEMFRASPIQRAKHAGFLRNVAIAMGNSGRAEFREPLETLAQSANEMVAEHARWALDQLGQTKPSAASSIERSPRPVVS